MAGPLAKYAFINAKVRARISKLLSDETLQHMIRAGSLEEALGLLRNTSFAALEDIYTKTGDITLGERELIRDEIGIYVTIERQVHREIRDFVNALLYRYEIDNLKNAIRLFFDRTVRGRSIDEAVHYLIYDTIIHKIAIDAIVNAETLHAIAEILTATPYKAIIEKHSETVARDNSLFLLEVAFDHFFYENLLIQAEKLSGTDRKEALRLIGVEIDLQNINWMMRLKTFYKMPLDMVRTLLIPRGFNLAPHHMEGLYAQQNITPVLQGFVKKGYPGLSTLLSSQTTDLSSRLSLIEQVLEQIMRHEIQRMLSGYPFTIGIILSYFILKHNEIKKVTTVLHAKHYALSHNRIESLL